MPKPAEPARPRILWWVAGFSLVSGGLLAVALGWFRAEALHAGEQLTRALGHVIAEQTTRNLQAVDVRMQLAGHKLREMEAGGKLDTEAVRAMLGRSIAGLPFVRNLWVVDPQGRIRFWSMAGSADFSVQDREYFRAHLDRTDAGFHVGRLVRSRVTHKDILVTSRALREPGGELRWVVAAAIEPPYFQSAWRELNLGTQGVIVLFHRSGQLMIRSPAGDAAAGRDFSRLRQFSELLPAAADGVFRARSALDEIDRLMAYRTLPLYPQLVVTVGSSVPQLLADWRRFAWLTGGLWLLAVAAAAILGWLLQRQALRRHHLEQRFGELAQAMPQIVFITDADGVVQFMNERWSEATGRPVAQVLGARWDELAADPDDTRRAAAERVVRAAEKVPAQVEMRLRYRDGSDRWQLVRAIPNRNGQGNVVSWYGTSTDVHELKLAQAQLERQAEMLRMAGRLARMGGWELQVSTGLINWSEAAREVLGFGERPPLRIDDLLLVLPPASRDKVRDAVRRSVEQGAPFEVEGEMVTPLGRLLCRAIGQPVRDAAGAVVRLQGAVQDITRVMHLVDQVRELNATLEERIELRTGELRQQEALFRTLAQEAPLPIWTVDPRGRLTFISRAWYDLVGGESPEWLGSDWMALVHPEDLAKMLHDWKLCVRDGATFQGTRRIRARDGTWHTTTFQASPVRGADGQITFWVGVDTDITDLMAHETELRLANEQLQSFSYSVSHDLQSPLQRIGAFAQLLQQEMEAVPGGARATHYLQRIRANVEEMVQLVQGLLSLARVSQAEIVRARVDLSSLATDILQRLKAESPGRQVRWQVEPGLVVLGDARLMRSVLDNLLGNAWKFTSKREQATIVFGGGELRGEFFVRDDGAGFEMAHADKLFGTFQRLHRQDEFPGTGVGLATVARAIARQGGRVWAEAQPDRGATFWFTLPVPG